MNISRVNSTAFKGLLEVNGTYYNTDIIEGFKENTQHRFKAGTDGVLFPQENDVFIYLNSNICNGPICCEELGLNKILDAYKKASASKDAIVKTSM